MSRFYSLLSNWVRSHTFRSPQKLAEEVQEVFWSIRRTLLYVVYGLHKMATFCENRLEIHEHLPDSPESPTSCCPVVSNLKRNPKGICGLPIWQRRRRGCRVLFPSFSLCKAGFESLRNEKKKKSQETGRRLNVLQLYTPTLLSRSNSY